MPVLRLPRDVTVVAFAWVALQLLDVPRLTYYLRPFEFERFLPDITQFRYVHLGVALYVIFRLWPLPRRFLVADITLAVLALVCAGYSTTYDAPLTSGTASPIDILVTAAGILLLLEAIRRVLGWPTAIVVAAFPVRDLYDWYLLDGFSGMLYPPSRLWVGSEGIFGYAMGLSASAGFLFILLGALIQQASVGKVVNRAVGRMLAAVCGPQNPRVVFRAFRNRLLIWTLVALCLLLTAKGPFLLDNWTAGWLWKPAAYSQVLGFLMLFIAVSLPFMRISRFSGEPDTSAKAVGDGLWLSGAAVVFGAIAVNRGFPTGTAVFWTYMIAIPAFLAWGWREDRRIDTSLTRSRVLYVELHRIIGPLMGLPAGFLKTRVLLCWSSFLALYAWWQPIFIRAAATVSGTATSALLLATAFFAASLLLALNFGVTQVVWSNLPQATPAPFIVVAGMAIAFGILRIGLRRWRPIATGLTLHLLLWLIPIHVVFFAAFHARVTAGSAAFYAVCTAAICLALQRIAERQAPGNGQRLGRRLAKDTFCIVARCVTAAAMIAVAAGAVGIVLGSGAHYQRY